MMQTIGEQDRSANGEHQWNPEQVQRQAVERLTSEFSGLIPAETINHHVAEALQHFEGVKIKDFVPIFVQRNAQERLRSLLQAPD